MNKLTVDHFPDAGLGPVLKAMVLEGVLLNNWQYGYLTTRLLKYLDLELEYTGEDFRVLFTDVLGPPKSSHFWGAITNRWISQGLIEQIGMDRMYQPRSHGHMTPTYRLVK